MWSEYTHAASESEALRDDKVPAEVALMQLGKENSFFGGCLGCLRRWTRLARTDRGFPTFDAPITQKAGHEQEPSCCHLHENVM
jgi:hypothetical protein